MISRLTSGLFIALLCASVFLTRVTAGRSCPGFSGVLEFHWTSDFDSLIDGRVPGWAPTGLQFVHARRRTMTKTTRLETRRVRVLMIAASSTCPNLTWSPRALTTVCAGLRVCAQPKSGERVRVRVLPSSRVNRAYPRPPACALPHRDCRALDCPLLLPLPCLPLSEKEQESHYHQMRNRLPLIHAQPPIGTGNTSDHHTTMSTPDADEGSCRRR